MNLSLTQTFMGLTVYSGLLLLVFNYLSKKLLEHRLTKDIELYKSQLKCENDVQLVKVKEELNAGYSIEIERLRANLLVETNRHQVIFSELHKKRASLIDKLYKKLVYADAAVGRFVSPISRAGDPEDEEMGNEASKRVKELSKFLMFNKIYFKLELWMKLKKLLDTFWDTAEDRFLAIQYREDSNERVSKWREVWDVMRKEVPPIKEDIENEFRKLVGVFDNSD